MTVSLWSLVQHNKAGGLVIYLAFEAYISVPLFSEKFDDLGVGGVHFSHGQKI